MGIERRSPGAPPIWGSRIQWRRYVASGDIPVVWPNNLRSTTWPMIPDKNKKQRVVSATMLQPGSTAAASARGMAAAIKALA